MMRRVSHHVAALAALVCFASFAAAEDIATFSDVQLIEGNPEAVVAQDAEAALDLLTEMQRRGTGIFAGVDGETCNEVIDLPEGITDWRFKGAARQAYITAAKTKALEAGTCGCLFDSYSFDMFTSEILRQAGCRPQPTMIVPSSSSYLTQHQRETGAERYRDLRSVCRTMRSHGHHCRHPDPGRCRRNRGWRHGVRCRGRRDCAGSSGSARSWWWRWSAST